MQASDQFTGRFICGTGDVEYLRLLDIALRMFHEDPEVPNISMMYTPEWNGLYEGASWNAWWTQNSYGPSFCILPFLQEPYLTFLANANDLWFQWIGDDKKADLRGAIPPDGCLSDCAAPNGMHARQGDGEFTQHDFAVEFTGAGIVIQGELLLVTRDRQALAHYLPMLERCAAFLQTRFDPANNLFRVGFAGNLLGPSWTGTIYPDGRLAMGYLAGMSITYIAAMDRMIELEKLAGNLDKADHYTACRDRARLGLQHLVTDEGYFVKGIDFLGVKHGVYGAERHGYFETNVNVDAVAFGVVDEAQARKIMDTIASIPGLRPHGLTVANYPALDDMVDHDNGYGNWVNGGHWSTTEARAMLAYARVGRYADAAEGMQRIMRFFDNYLIDNPLTNFGSEVWFKQRVTTIIYDGFGVPAGLLRGLFQPVYTADALTLTPSIPTGITSLHGCAPMRFGDKRIQVSVTRQHVQAPSVTLNGAGWQQFDGTTITLPYDSIPEHCEIAIVLPEAAGITQPITPLDEPIKETVSTNDRFAAREHVLTAVEKTLRSLQPAPEFETAFIQSARNAIAAYRTRTARDAGGRYAQFTAEKREAIIALYEKAADDLLTGLDAHLRSLSDATDPSRAALATAYIQAMDSAGIPTR